MLSEGACSSLVRSTFTVKLYWDWLPIALLLPDSVLLVPAMGCSKDQGTGTSLLEMVPVCEDSLLAVPPALELDP